MTRTPARELAAHDCDFLVSEQAANLLTVIDADLGRPDPRQH